MTSTTVTVAETILIPMNYLVRREDQASGIAVTACNAYRSTAQDGKRLHLNRIAFTQLGYFLEGPRPRDERHSQAGGASTTQGAQNPAGLPEKARIEYIPPLSTRRGCQRPASTRTTGTDVPRSTVVQTLNLDRAYKQ